MDSYISVKLVKAKPTFKDGIPGHKIVYPDGYESYCPDTVFNKAYLPLVINPDLKTTEPSISQKMVDDFISKVYTSTNNDTGHPITMTTVVCRNGFTDTSTSTCVSEENYSKEVGEEVNIQNIKNDIWGFLGFLLSCAKNGFYVGKDVPQFDPLYRYKHVDE